MQTDWKKVFQIFVFFVKTGCFTFGGGWSIIAQIQADFVEKRGWLTSNQLLDFASVGRSMPGTMICNVCYLSGYSIAGVFGAVAAVVGIALAPFMVICLMTLFYEQFKESQMATQALVGIRAAVIPIILLSVLKMQKGTLHGKLPLVIAVCAGGIAYLFRVNNALIIICAAVVGILINNKGKNKDA